MYLTEINASNVLTFNWVLSFAHILFTNENIRSTGALDPERHKEISTILQMFLKTISFAVKCSKISTHREYKCEK